jgi:hypothetical protein
MNEFWVRFGITAETIILDAGGDPFNWSLMPDLPELVFLNLYGAKWTKIGWVIGDVRYLPFKNGSFEIVFSNSVIEHLGTLNNQELFASECRRVGCHYYVQTPNKFFPIEPHLITPFIHWLPEWLQLRLMRNFTVWGLITRPKRQDCENLLNEIRLLNKQEFQNLFPDAEIVLERFLGITKSFIAMKI